MNDHQPDHGSQQRQPSCPSCASIPSSFTLSRKVKITGLIFLVVLAASFHPVLTPLNNSLLSYIQAIWWAILLGFFIGGLIDHFVPQEFIFRYMGQKKKRSILFALVAGFLMSACSHGILAIAMQLYKKGANIPAVMTFLLSSPWANLPVTILLFGFFGWQALLFIGAAMIIAVITGLIYMILEKYELIEPSLEVDQNPNYRWENVVNFNFKKAIRGVGKGAMDLMNMVLWWILIGITLAGFIGAYLPQEIFVQYLGPTILGMFITLVFATILEVCSEGSAPIAFEIFKQVGVLGNPFIFLMAGVATDYTEIGLIWSNIGKRAALWLPVINVPLILVAGYLFNTLL